MWLSKTSVQILRFYEVLLMIERIGIPVIGKAKKDLDNSEIPIS